MTPDEERAVAEAYRQVAAARKETARRRIAHVLSYERDSGHARTSLDSIERAVEIALTDQVDITLTHEQLDTLCAELRDGLRWRDQGRKLAEALRPFLPRH